MLPTGSGSPSIWTGLPGFGHDRVCRMSHEQTRIFFSTLHDTPSTPREDPEDASDRLAGQYNTHRSQVVLATTAVCRSADLFPQYVGRPSLDQGVGRAQAQLVACGMLRPINMVRTKGLPSFTSAIAEVGPGGRESGPGHGRFKPWVLRRGGGCCQAGRYKVIEHDGIISAHRRNKRQGLDLWIRLPEPRCVTITHLIRTDAA